MRARHRLSKLLLRHDVRYADTASRWGERHRAWLAKVDLGERGARLTMSEYVGAIDALQIRRQTLEAAIRELIASSPWAQDVDRLRCLRGIDTLSAVGLAVEVGDFARFEHPKLIAWKAQQRLHHVWRQLDLKRGKRRTVVAVAVARQLAGFCWTIVTHQPPCEPRERS
jgi:hypothetical protein